MYKVNIVDHLENVWNIGEENTKKAAIALAKEYFDHDKECVSAFVERNKEIVFYSNRENTNEVARQ